MPSASHLFSALEQPLILLGLLSLFVYLAGLFLGRWLKRKLQVRLTWTTHLFIACAAIAIAARLSKVDFPGLSEFGFVAMIAAVFPINALLHRFAWPIFGYPGPRSRIPPFLPQVAAILLGTSLILFGLASFYRLTLTGLLAGSGLIAIIIGIALQETLGNIFAGFGLQAGRAYRAGDWLILNGQPVEVIEINWRSTRFLNNDDVSLEMPNSQLAKAVITNLSYPTITHALRIRIGVEYTVPPNLVKEALLSVAARVRQVLTNPTPRVFLVQFEESAVSYELKFWINDGKIHQSVMDEVRTLCWYELNRRKIPFSVPVRRIESGSSMRTNDDEAGALDLLGRQLIFSSLQADQIEILARQTNHFRFGRGESIIKEGEPGDSMFILAHGSAEVFAKNEDTPLNVGTLGAGDCFGEMSLLTGESRSATVIAVSDCQVVEIPKRAVAALLHEQPELAGRLSETLATRRLLTQAALAKAKKITSDSAPEDVRQGILNRLRDFFQL